MRSLLPLLFLAAAPCCSIAQNVTPGTPVYKVNNITREQLKGPVKVQTTMFYENAQRTTAQWEPTDRSSYLSTITYFNNRGFVDSVVSGYVFEGVARPALKKVYKYVGDSLVEQIKYMNKESSKVVVEYPQPLTIVEKGYRPNRSKAPYLSSIYETVYDENYRLISYSAKQFDENGGVKINISTTHRHNGDTDYIRTINDGKTTNVTSEIVAKDDRGNKTIEVGRSDDGSKPTITVHSYQYR